MSTWWNFSQKCYSYVHDNDDDDFHTQCYSVCQIFALYEVCWTLSNFFHHFIATREKLWQNSIAVTFICNVKCSWSINKKLRLLQTDRASAEVLSCCTAVWRILKRLTTSEGPWWILNFFGNIAVHTTVLRPFFRDHPGEPVPEENFWTSWCKGWLTEVDTQTIRLGATPSGLTNAHLHHPLFVYRPDALLASQPTVSKHWRQLAHSD